MDHKVIKEHLTRVDVFAPLPPSTLDRLAFDCREIKLNPGEVLFREGDPGSVMYVVLFGNLIISKESQAIAILESEHVFGEMAVIEHKPRSATVVAKMEALVLEITRKQFFSLLACNFPFMMAILGKLSERSRGNMEDLALGYKKMRAQEKLSSNLHRILDDFPNEIYLFDSNSHQIVRANSQSRHNLGYSNEEITALTPFDVIKEMNQEKLDTLYQALFDEKKLFVTFEGYHCRRDGSTYRVEIRLQILETENAKLIIAIIRDNSDPRFLKEQLKKIASFDVLTGLPNRNLAKDRLAMSLARSQRSGGIVAVFLLDIDNFKTINDSLGDHAGDVLLNMIAQRLTECLRKEDTVARLGGDEFLIILSGLKEEGSVNLIAEKVMQCLNPALEVENHEIHASLSLGISLYPNDGLEPETLLKNAEVAMYQAKESGKGALRYFDSNLLHKARQKMKLESGLYRALKEKELVLFYQPKVDLKSGRIMGLEALIRWNHPETGLVPPGDFIPVAEDSGIIIPIGEWVLTEACKQLKAWVTMGFSSLEVAVNISGKQFNQKNLVERVEKNISASGIRPAQLELELTETILMEHSGTAFTCLHQLKEIGVNLSIDDFGTGYSSMAYLKNMPINHLKIDQSFIQNVTEGADEAIFKAIVSLAKTLNLKTTAEGVETTDQKEFLYSIHCDFMQGYLFSKPLPVPAITSLLQSNLKTATTPIR